jgi:hypothetical protein
MPVIGRTTEMALVSLSLDGKACGFVRSVVGGDITAPVIPEASGPDGFVVKRLGSPVVEDLELKVGLSMDSALYDWIAATWDRKFERKDGAIVASDASRKATTTRPFTQALISATTFAAFDASSKDAASMTVRLAPENITTATATGTLGAPPPDKKWLAANFRLELDGIDCSKVNKIDSFTVELVLAVHTIGEDRDPTVSPGALEFPTLSVSVADDSAQTWAAWFDDFVVKGNNDPSKEKGGAIVFLAPDLKTELGRVILHNVGICALRHPLQGSGAEQVFRLTAELYCERMELQIGAPVVTPTPTPDPVHIVPPPPIKPSRVGG